MFQLPAENDVDHTSFIPRGINRLLTTYVPAIYRKTCKISTMLYGVRYTMEVTNIRCQTSPESVDDCLKNGGSMTAGVMGTITLSSMDETDVKVDICSVDTRVGRIPLVTGFDSVLHEPLIADESHDLPSGVFVIYGKCRSLPPVKNMLFNVPLLFDKRKEFCVQVRSNAHDKPYRWSSTLSLILPKVAKRDPKLVNQILLSLPFQRSRVTVSTLAMALGAGSMTRFFKMVEKHAGDKYSRRVFRQYEITMQNQCTVRTHEEALIKLGRSFANPTVNGGWGTIRSVVLPHTSLMGWNDQEGKFLKDKLEYLAMSVALLILLKHGLVKQTYRDHYENCRVTSTADLLGQLLKMLLTKHMNNCSKLLRRTLMMSMRRDETRRAFTDLTKLFAEPRLTGRLLSAIANGSWSAMKRGVTMTLNTNNEDAMMSQLSRLSSSMTTTDSVNTGPRDCQHDGYGYIDPANTPDGEQVGLVNEFACTTDITTDVVDEKLFNMLLAKLYRSLDICEVEEEEEEEVERTTNHEMVMVYNVSGIYVGQTSNVQLTVDKFRKLRRAGVLPGGVFVQYIKDRRQLWLHSGAGLLTRPLVVASRASEYDKKRHVKAQIVEGIVEMVSPCEEYTVCRVALRITDIVDDTVTHMELDPANIFGRMAMQVPYASQQQGPRLAYTCHQRGQYMTANKKRRLGAIRTTELNNCHRPLVTTRRALMMPNGGAGRGTPVVIAIGILPWIQEDGIAVSKAMIERGGMSASTTRHYVSDIPTPTATSFETFERPSDTVNSKKDSDYSCINPKTGFASGYVRGGSVVIGKTQTKRVGPKGSVVRIRDISTVSRFDEHGHVTDVNVTKMGDAGTRAIVSIRTERVPIKGDKLSSGHSQKGVLTSIVPCEDLPFAMQSGIIPSVWVSPAQLPSRMTVGTLAECLTGKVVAITGDRNIGVDQQEYKSDGREHMKMLEKHLLANGYSRDGTEIFCDGRTGKMIKARIFTGIVTYFRLVHLAEPKLLSRHIGPRDPVTRQPTNGGRKNHGGLRFGELEVAASASHGMSEALCSQLVDLSDGFECFVCSKCNRFANGNATDNIKWCHRCHDDECVKTVRISFTLVVQLAELNALGLSAKLIVK
jgi:DNA-directed RNA polymerase beta subunit